MKKILSVLLIALWVVAVMPVKVNADSSTVTTWSDLQTAFFEVAEVANENMETAPYHVEKPNDCLHEELCDVNIKDGEDEGDVPKNDGFSYYTVDFTYGELEYVLDGGTKVTLEEILGYLGIMGDIKAAVFSNPELVDVSKNEDGVWNVTSLKSFTTDEKLIVTIAGEDFDIDFEIEVTDPFWINKISSFVSELNQKGDISRYVIEGTYYETINNSSRGVCLLFSPEEYTNSISNAAYKDGSERYIYRYPDTTETSGGGYKEYPYNDVSGALSERKLFTSTSGDYVPIEFDFEKFNYGSLDLNKSYSIFIANVVDYNKNNYFDVSFNNGKGRAAALLPLKLSLYKENANELGSYSSIFEKNTHFIEGGTISYDSWPVASVAGDGYHFNASKSSGAGICTAKSGVGSSDTSNRQAQDVTIYYDLDRFTVSFDANGGTGAPTSIENVAYGTKVTAPTTKPIREGYAFEGWYKEDACTNEWNFETDTVTSATTLYAKWTKAVANVTVDGETTTYPTLKSAIEATKTGKIVLIGDTTENVTVNSSKDITLDLNGKVLTGTGENSVITIESGAKLTLDDNSTEKTGKITGGKGYSRGSERLGGGVYVASGGNFVMNGGTIYGCTATKGGGVFTWGNFTMNNSSAIVECQATVDGGGVCACNCLVTINDSSKVSKCTAGNGAGGVYIFGNPDVTASFIMNDNSTISECTAHANMSGNQRSGGGVCVEGNLCEFTMNGGSITAGNTVRGGGVYVFSGTFTMKGGSITGNTANNDGAGVYVDAGGKLVMEDGTISTNSATANGGGVFVHKANFTMSGGKISGNTGIYGGGVCGLCDINLKTEFTMSGGEIGGNTATYGGGVHLNGVNFTMNSGTISENTATYSGDAGGGVHLSGATFIMNNGTISKNKASVGYGGGIFVPAGSNFTMNGGTIESNSAYYWAGGVCNKGIFIMNDGAVSNNEAEYASGGGVSNAGSVIMLGGAITGNKARENGGGFYSGGTSGALTLGKAAKITGNVVNNTSNNVYLENGRIITLKTDDSKPTEGMTVGITTATAPTATTLVAITGDNGADYSSYFASDNSDFAIKNVENTLQLMKAGRITNNTAETAKNTNYGFITIDKETALKGDSVTVGVNPNTGYSLKSLKYNDGSDHDINKDATTGKYQFTMPSGDISVTAVFEHIHSYTYSVDSGSAHILKATCIEGCPDGYYTTPLTLTLTKPSSFAYDGSAKEITFASEEKTKWEATGTGLGEVPAIVYAAKTGSELTDSKPVNVGEYTASITVNNVTATLDFEIVADASKVTTAPIAQLLLEYNGSDLTLVTEGVAENGTMNYVLGTDAATAPDSGWSGDIPTGKNAGTYYVWYKSVGNSGYADTTPLCVEVTVSKKDITNATVGDFAAMSYTGEAQTPSAAVTIDGLTVTGAWSDVTEPEDKTSFTANGNFTGILKDYATGMTAPAPDGELLVPPEKEQENFSGGGMANSAEELKSMVVSAEDAEEMQKGKDISVWLEVKEKPEITPEETAIVENAMPSEFDQLLKLDVSLWKQVEGQDASKVSTVSNGAITVKFTVPAELRKDNREYKVLKIHDNVAEILDAEYSADGQIVFRTSSFSTYILIYRDKEDKPVEVYYAPLVADLRANENGTIIWEAGDGLPLEAVRLLVEKPELSLEFTFTYENEEHTIFIPAGAFEQYYDVNIPWYGPAWLIGHFEKAEKTVIEYTIVKDDTLNDLSVKFGCTVEEILALNPYVTDSHWIYPNNKLLIPVQQ